MIRLDNDAVEMLPSRLLISIAVIATIIFLVMNAWGTLQIFLAEHNVEQQCQVLVSSLSTMVEDGGFRDVDELNVADGDKRMQTFLLPDSLVYLCFGGDPEGGDADGFTPKLFEDGAVIFYRVQGGGKKVLWLPKETYKFREGIFFDNRWGIKGTGNSFMVSSSGAVSLVFERVQKNHRKYILVYKNVGSTSPEK